ncbi:tRNA-intron lyase [Geoglobus acetivorans]|uniref:tRNA-intron endonuclease n=1 Tax=Geoglobus acetivorans TaxID=565033 RepID=A0A0A7GHH2_GEOAI|nr:tRNA-intron endonuclease [Geoglobus acetivorans]
MKGLLRGENIIVEKAQKLISRNFGTAEGNSVILTPEEAAYLVYKGTLEVFSDDEHIVDFDRLFKLCNPVKYFVFQDLRDRGIRVRFLDFGDYFPASEKDCFSVEELKRMCGKKLAIVDEEADVTYFKIETFDGRGNHYEELKKFSSRFSGGYFITENTELYRRYFYGVLRGNRVIMSIYEGLYLMETGIMEADVEKKEVLELARKTIPDFEKIFTVYRDLRERKFMVKTGFKFGSEFRVYEQVKNVSELRHSKYLVKLRSSFNLRELAGDVRLSGAVNKTLIYPILGKSPEYIAVRRVRI